MVYDPKYYIKPFGIDGDLAAIPDAAQPDGSVSYEQAFPIDYSLNKNTNPAAKAVPRTQFNQLMLDVTANIQQYWQYGCPEFITSVKNGGTPFPYSKKAICRYVKSSGVTGIFQSLADSNTDAPETSPGVFSNAWNEIPYRLNAIDTGTSNAIQIFAGKNLAVSAPGVMLVVRANASNLSGPCTIQIGNNGAELKPVKVFYHSTTTDPLLGMIVAGGTYIFIENNNQYYLMNPSPIISEQLFCRVTFTPTGTDVVGPLTTNHKILFNSTAVGQTSWWDAANHQFICAGPFGYYTLTGVVNSTGGGTSQQFLAGIKNGTTAVVANNAVPTGAIAPTSITLPGNTFVLDTSLDTVYAAWTNTAPVASTTVGDDGNGIFTASELNFIQLTFVGSNI